MDLPAMAGAPVTAGPRDVRALLRRGMLWAVFYGASDAAARFALHFVPALLLLVLWDFLAPPPRGLLRTLWGAAAAAAFAGALRAAGGGFSRRAVAKALGAALSPADLLLNQWENSRAPVDTDAPFLRREEARLSAQRGLIVPRRALRPRGWALRAASAAFLLAALLPFRGARPVQPWSEEAPWITVSPGNARVPRGGDVALVLSLSRREGPPPRVILKGAGPRQERTPLPAPDGTYRLVLEKVLEPVSYSVRREFLRTETFRIVPFRPAAFKRLSLSVRPPAYTGLPVEVWRDVLSLRAPQGSLIDGEGVLDRNLRSAVLRDAEGGEIPVQRDGGRIRFRAELRRSGLWRMDLVDEAGDSSTVLLAVDASPDAPPELRLLSPEGSLALSARERLAVVYEAEDDHGLSSVTLFCRAEGGETRAFPLPPGNGSGEEIVTPSRLGLPPGARAELWMEARDNNPAGPGTARSPAVSLLVSDGGEERRDEDLERWRAALMAARTDEALLRDKSRGPAPSWPDLAARQRLAAEGIDGLARRLKEITRSMAADPRADPWLAAEHEAAASFLDDLQRDSLPRAEKALSTGDAGAAGAALDEVVRSLDRAAAASEEAHRTARARALGAREDLTDAAEDLSRLLDGPPAARDARTDEILKELSDTLQDIARALSKTPGLLPDVPPGADPARVLRLDEMMGDLAQVQKALQKGDVDGARAAAARFLEKARALKELLGRAADNASSDGGAPKALAEAASMTQALAEKQAALKSKAQSLIDAAYLRLKREQEEVLRSTRTVPMPRTPSYDESSRLSAANQSREQRTLREDADALSSALRTAAEKTFLFPMEVFGRLEKASAAMERAAQALSQALLPEAVAAQEEALSYLEDNARELSSSSSAGGMPAASFPSGMGVGAGRSSGAAGAPVGPTRLPRLQDYRPPKEFREDVLRALEEKAPARDRPLIEDYFKRWKK